jgi:hypothetical protein
MKATQANPADKLRILMRGEGLEVFINAILLKRSQSLASQIRDESDEPAHSGSQ